ncbi:(2Fe-2S)-binding protein [Myxococcota bacterium]|nr:(2Fe-2S)-binding protein [Myxococcota bacterium]
MPTLTIDGRTITVEPGTRVIEAADRLGIDIPRFCYHPGLSVAANCRMCLVETNKSPKPVPSCYEMCADGLEVKTRTDRILEARRAVLEFILLNHPVDCPICDQAGECDLQDLYFAHDHQPSRHFFRKHHKAKARVLGPQVIYDGERCINCTRCIRVCNEVAKSPQLTQVQRGERTCIDIFPGQPLDHPYSMCTADVCPVGALTTRDFRFKCRAWLVHGIDSACTGCSRGCSVRVDVYRNAVQRVVPRPNPDVNQYWACDAGRLLYHRYESGRLAQVRREGSPATIREAIAALAEGLLAIPEPRVGAVLWAGMTLEDAWAVVTLVRSLDPRAPIFLAGMPEGAGDDILIRPDKNANRTGLNRLLEALGAAPMALEALPGQARDLQALWAFGEDLPDPVVQAVRATPLGVFHGPREEAAARQAPFAFPGTSPFETDGTVVNEFGIAQRLRRAVLPPAETTSPAEFARALAERLGKPLVPPGEPDLCSAIGRVLEGLLGFSTASVGRHGLRIGALPGRAP